MDSPGSVIVPYNGTDTLLQHMWKQTCNVVAGEPLFLLKVKLPYFNATIQQPLPDYDYNTTHPQPWKLGSRILSKEPLAVVTLNDDPHWSALANVMVNAFIIAEAYNITKLNAPDMATLFRKPTHAHTTQTSPDEQQLASLLVSLIATFGNQGDLYRQQIETQIPRGHALNRPYDKYQSTGLLYSLPFGVLDDYDRSPIVNGTLDTILHRGYLICGLQPSRGPAFVRKAANDTVNITTSTTTATAHQEWAGFDVEICRGIAGSLFAGDKSKIQFVEVISTSTPSQTINVPNKASSSYASLAAQEVDVVAGVRMTLQAIYREPTTGHGYSFSPPYYYDNDTKDGYAFMVRSEDEEWSDYVYWIVHALVFAEEEGITSEISANMPVVTLFGERLKQAFRDCIASVGSFAELYNNTLQEFIPRAGANRLNEHLKGAQMVPIPLN
jgi:ABC-type amino acid transport substrate-binding protein